MKFIFNPYYDQRLYLGREEGCLLGEKYVGPMELLGELELRAGLSKPGKGETARMLGYCEALDLCGQAAGDPDSLFYWKSYSVDRLNTSRRLLEWRDALVYAGVKRLASLPEGLSAGAEAIVADLLDVEEYFNDESSPSDRWCLLAAESDYLPEDWTIEVRMKEELVDPVILKCLKQSGAKCIFVSELPEISHKVKMYRFANLLDGYQWTMANPEGAGDVYVNAGNVALNAVLASLGKPFVEASSSGVYTQISQLFSSGLKLFVSPVDCQALVSYLSVPVHPLNSYMVAETKSLRSALLAHLMNVGGFGANEKTGEDWESIVANAEAKDSAMPLSYCLGQWEKGADIREIEKYCEVWSKWCERAARGLSDISLSEQLYGVKESFELFPKFLRMLSKDKFTSEELNLNIAAASSLSRYSTGEAMVGSIETVTDVKAIAAPCERAVWLDCYEKGMAGYQYSFLNDSDIKCLNDAGMMIPLYADQLKAEAVAMHIGYANVKKELVVLTPEKVEGTKFYPCLIPHWDGEPEDMTQWTPEGREIAVVDAATAKEVYEVPSALFEGRLGREYESYSSINMLIEQPFDYAMNYIFKCAEKSEGYLATVKGNVAHMLIHNAVNASGKDMSMVKMYLVDDFDANLDKAVNEVGIELLSSDNALEYNLFRTKLKDCCIPAFISILEENDLEIVSSEEKIRVELPGIGQFEAKIDMVLRHPNGRYVIMDFKWTDGKEDKRREEIEKNKEMQLALYAETVGRHFPQAVEAVGYFMLRSGTFFTAYDGFKRSKHIKVVKKKKTDSIFEAVKVKYQSEMLQLKGSEGISSIRFGKNDYPVNVVLKGDLE